MDLADVTESIPQRAAFKFKNWELSLKDRKPIRGVL